MRTLYQCILAIPVDKAATDTHLPEPGEVRWAGRRKALPLPPMVGDIVPLGKGTFLSVEQRLHLSIGVNPPEEDLLLVVSLGFHNGGPDGSANPSDDTLLRLPKGVVVDPMVWHELYLFGFEEIVWAERKFPTEAMEALMARYPLTKV